MGLVEDYMKLQDKYNEEHRRREATEKEVEELRGKVSDLELAARLKDKARERTNDTAVAKLAAVGQRILDYRDGDASLDEVLSTLDGSVKHWRIKVDEDFYATASFDDWDEGEYIIVEVPKP